MVSYFTILTHYFLMCLVFCSLPSNGDSLAGFLSLTQAVLQQCGFMYHPVWTCKDLPEGSAAPTVSCLCIGSLCAATITSYSLFSLHHSLHCQEKAKQSSYKAQLFCPLCLIAPSLQSALPSKSFTTFAAELHM